MYPKTLSKFRAWAKAMEVNATVSTPDYGKTAARPTGSKVSRTRRKRRRRRKKKNDA